MTIRSQKNGKQKPWTLEELKVGLQHFYKEYSHYPSSSEVDRYGYLPSARSIERSFGGLVKLRKKFGLGDVDLRTGEHSSQRARTINRRAHLVEREVYDFLTNRFGKEFVHREYFFTDDHRTRADFFVYEGSEGFCVDVFYPNSLRNLTGCLNLKLNKYKGAETLLPYPVIFLQMNRELSQDALDRLLERKEKRLSVGQYLMGWENFEEFCMKRDPLKVLKAQTTMRRVGSPRKY